VESIPKRYPLFTAHIYCIKTFLIQIPYLTSSIPV
jgi:hypothetical protein